MHSSSLLFNLFSATVQRARFVNHNQPNPNRRSRKAELRRSRDFPIRSEWRCEVGRWFG
jgi:hypothetical protein